MSDYYSEVQKLKDSYPDWHSAMLPALRRAQEEHGYLSPEALRECADALGTTPALCEAVASFYDMLHLTPIGKHMVEVCTNVSCALVGAQQVLEAFERELLNPHASAPRRSQGRLRDERAHGNARRQRRRAHGRSRRRTRSRAA